MSAPCETLDLLVFAHTRWDFVFQRPQHLMSRFAKYRRVYYFEEPIFGMTDQPRLHMRETSEGVHVYVPYLPKITKSEDIEAALRDLVNELIFEEAISEYSCWFYSPMAWSFTNHLKPAAVIFDWMEELLPMTEFEAQLAEKADLVFTDGQSLFEEKRKFFSNLHFFPSSIDYAHFAQGRMQLVEPDDQINIPHPRLGFCGVLDGNLDAELIGYIADQYPDWQLVVIGPLVKVEAETLFKRTNIHYLGRKDFHALPLYFAGWDCAILPFKQHSHVNAINPSKIPEYLAAGKPVVSTALPDIVSSFGDAGLVYVADSAQNFVTLVEKAMLNKQRDLEWLERVDSYLAQTSWDMTFKKMAALERKVIEARNLMPNPLTLPTLNELQ